MLIKMHNLSFYVFFVEVAHIANAIINGDIVEISDYPYAASILSGNVHRCGGSIIDVKYILTAASCVANYNATNLTVRAGSSYYNEYGQNVKVETINIHPYYSDPFNLTFNIAVLELSTELVLGDNVTVIPVDTTGNIKNVDSTGDIVGWGISVRQESGWVRPYKPSLQLRHASQPVIGYWVCKKNYIGWDGETMFCAGLSMKDNCVGDIGNPFVFNGTQVGVAAETLLMCGQFPTSYVNVTAYADFINEFIKT